MARLLFSLQGRINRLDFLRGALLLLIPCAVAFGLAMVGAASLSAPLISAAALLLVVPLYALVCLLVKRLRDLGISGWVVLILLAALLMPTMIEDYAFSTLGANSIETAIRSTDIPLYITLLPAIPWGAAAIFLAVCGAIPGKAGDEQR